MGFYGNISNDSKTNLTFDRIYANRMTMDQNAENDGVFVGRFVLVEYDDNTYMRRLAFKNPEEPQNKLYADPDYKLPYFLSEDTREGYGLQAGDLVYIKTPEGFNEFFRATGEKFETDNSAVFVAVATSNGDPGDYVLNYNTDKAAYPGHFTTGWDSTIWQKSIVNGKERYRMIATLNSIIPRFGVVAEAPSDDPIAPHFGYENTNVDYVLHMPTNWGFRIKEAENEETSDLFEKYTEENENGEVIEKTKYLDIYYNKDGFEKTERTYKENAKDYITLLPTGKSGDNYIVHEEDGSTVIRDKEDIQEFSLHLPSIGNIASNFWDLLYGTERNTELGWDSSEGIRFIAKDKATGNYIFDKEKIETVAGTINSTQDLMGKIIRQGGDLKDADLNHIYYRIPEEGDTFRTGFYIKELSNELISFDELNEKYGLIFEDYKEYIGGKNPQYLTQYEPNYYHIMTESGVEGKNNYLCEIDESPTSDTQYYILNLNDIEALDIKDWNPTTEEEEEENPEGEVVSYFYREEEEYLGQKYYKYIEDNNENPDLEKDYYSLKTDRILDFNFYDPDEYSEVVRDEEGNTITKEYEDGNTYVVYQHKETAEEVDGQKLRRGYFYYLDTDKDGKELPEEQKRLVPVYTKSLSGLGSHLFNQKEEYYVFSYSLTINTKDDGTEVLVYKLNGIKDLVPEKDLVGNDLFVQKVIDFDTQEFYELKEEEEKTVYERVKSLEDIDKDNKKYFTIEATLLTGYLEKEPVEGEEETEEEIYTNFYLADTYYYKTSNNDYLLDRNSKITEGRQYYRFNKYPEPIVGLTFYEPNKYYYYSKSREEEGHSPDRLDDSLRMRTAEDPDVVIQKLDGREDFIYYLKRQTYVVADSSNHLRAGQVWSVNTNEVPEGVQLGALFNDIVDELKFNGYDVERKYIWRELKGYAETFNTINGLILQLNRAYRFEDEMTRDINTVQGTINTLKDYFSKFDMLTPGNLLAVNEYGQLDSQNPGELTLKGYQIATNANPITTEDTISQAFGKVEYKINVLNADASTEGSVAHAIAEIVEVDGGAIDKLKEISNWITDEDAGAAKIISDVATNAGDIVLNKTAIENLESLIDADKVAVWNKAEENVQADWMETSETADSFIKNKPDLSEMVKTSTTFDYIYNETTTAMTISTLMEKIAELEARIAILENPVSPEPEPEPEIPEEEPTE